MDPTAKTCPACGLPYTAAAPGDPCPACAAADAGAAAAPAARGDAAAPARRKLRNVLYVGALVALAAAWIVWVRPADRGPTVGDYLAVIERANRSGAGPEAPLGRTAIEYAHEQLPEESLYHGTFSDLDGFTQVTWTFDSGGATRTIDLPIAQERFDDLVAGFALLAPFQATDPDVIADLRRYHVIAIASDARTAQARVAVYLVPDPPGSNEIARWLKLLDVPRVPIGRRLPSRPRRPLDF